MEATEPVIAIADMYAIAGARGEVLALLAGLAGDAERQPGCLRYSVAELVGDPDHFVLISRWRDAAALEAHYGSSAYAEFQRMLHGLLAQPSEMTIYAVSGAARPLPPVEMDPRDAD